MTVPSVNAYYDPTKNEMVFPAGALMPQTFDATADLGANYGSLAGSWAGPRTHITASTTRDALRCGGQPARLVDAGGLGSFPATGGSGRQAIQRVSAGRHNPSSMAPSRSARIIADYGGVLTGFDALQHAMQRDGRPATIAGFTPSSVSFSDTHRAFARTNGTRRSRPGLTTDEHSPDRWRVNGPMSNSAAFATAFSCKPADPMVQNPTLVRRSGDGWRRCIHRCRIESRWRLPREARNAPSGTCPSNL